ncbi:hypothetical protein [uncultured Thiodictyon sp.]|uniref:hypothetical protein n=1 Tax=uncultured Thiodictyon sp. TaxID=1846217 RepID=UPI0025DE3CFE|nr:hypothetical protein [uncultured Thiodictyon sp.]
MQTFTFDCEIDAQHGVVLRLPRSVAPGRHRLAVIVDPPASAVAPDIPLRPVDTRTAPRTDLWRRLEALRAQAEETGALPAPMAWDAVLEEAERRRGERDD